MNIPDKLKRSLDEVFEAFSIVCEGTYVYVNDMSVDLSRWSRTAVDAFDLPGEYMTNAGGIWEEHIHPEDREAYHKSIDEIMRGAAGSHDMQYRARNRQGNYVMCTCRGVVIHDAEGKPAYFAGSIRNHGLEGDIDVMTGLRDQKGFLEDLEESLSEQKPFFAAILGINGFSEINTLYGYDFGNLVIQKTARLYLTQTLNGGRVYRLDGARFGLISKNFTPEQAEDAFNSFRDRTRKGFTIDGIHISFVVSEGGIYVDSYEVNSHTILACLESAYRRSGRNMLGDVTIFSARAGQKQAEALALLSDIRESVFQKCRGFLLYYQPIMNAQSQTLRGAEALIRYRDDRHGLVFPDTFIPFLENDSIFPELGSWILRRAMEDGARFVQKVPDFIMNVNLSYVQLEQAGFAEEVKRLLDETGFPARNLCLEITERCRFLDLQLLKSIMNDLRQYGVKFALDDFGTGFSSASLLNDLSFDTIKIDRAFVTGIDADTKKQNALSHLAGLARTFGSDVCVEGIEDEATREAVNRYHVTSLQGYLYSKPVPAEVFERDWV